MRAFAGMLAAVLWLATGPTLLGWGTDVHRSITQRAIDGLPAGLRPFVLAQREFVAEHSVDPDLWRIVGLSGALGNENANHYFNIDGLDEPRPFRGVPRDRAAFVRRYGARRASEAGRLPWQTADIYRKLVAAFRSVSRGAPTSALDASYLMSVLAHYVEDAHVPFHAVRNHDGQLSGQQGIHGRFETELVRRSLPGLRLASVRVRPIPDITEFVFQTLVESESLVAVVLEADRKASRGRPGYDAAYYTDFLAGVRPILERRLAESADGVASAVTAAWHEAGSPSLDERAQPPTRSIQR